MEDLHSCSQVLSGIMFPILRLLTLTAWLCSDRSGCGISVGYPKVPKLGPWMLMQQHTDSNGAFTRNPYFRLAAHDEKPSCSRTEMLPRVWQMHGVG